MQAPAKAIVFLTFLSLSSCSQGLSGVYTDELGTTAYDFRANDKVYITVLEVTVAADYTTHGNNIIVTSPQGTVVLAKQDNMLIGPMGQILRPQPS
ncbi:MAG: hypothetical protein NXH95_15095 [Pseudomonadaceae bacterium]|nr:hypothetical protein [Pseudomonadaceae bacterium]